MKTKNLFRDMGLTPLAMLAGLCLLGLGSGGGCAHAAPPDWSKVDAQLTPIQMAAAKPARPVFSDVPPELLESSPLPSDLTEAVAAPVPKSKVQSPESGVQSPKSKVQ